MLLLCFLKIKSEKAPQDAGKLTMMIMMMMMMMKMMMMIIIIIMGSWDSLFEERQTRDQKVVSSNPGRSGESFLLQS